MAVAIILAVLLLVVSTLLAVTWKRQKDLKRTIDNLRVVVDNQEYYTFLVDQNFEVKESNVKMADDQPHILGNVLHCKNSHDTGRCGEGEECRNCPIRFVISKSFERQDDFRNLEASLQLDGTDDSQSDVDVCVSGSFVCIDKVPHMVVNVKDMTTRDGSMRPKVLFISENAALFDKVCESLGISFRVLNVDTEHQALHRLLHASDYHFCAVMTDAAFYHGNNAVSIMLAERRSMLPVFVFAKENERVADLTVDYIDEDISSEELLKLVVSTVS